RRLHGPPDRALATCSTVDGVSETPADALRRRARTGLLESPERAPAGGHFRAMGVDPARLAGPIIGVASTWTGTMPCNLNQREPADRVSEGVAAAGGLALGFNTIAVSDNQSQGTPGMRASLISREVIADSIELMVHAHDFDGLVCVVGCDKTVPAALMALARVDKPAVLVYNGPMRAGRWHEREVTIQDVWEAVGAEERGLMPREDLDELERFACPGAGTCAGHFTANTMAIAIDCLGIACVGDALVPADERERGGHVDGEAPTVDGSTLGDVTVDAPQPDGEVVYTLETPFKPTGALHALRGNLAPEGSLVKVSGTTLRSHRGPARVFESEE